ncbi:MAG: hypothetical protein R2708_18590 [Vicinamibacterales bacterium]
MLPRRGGRLDTTAPAVGLLDVTDFASTVHTPGPGPHARGDERRRDRARDADGSEWDVSGVAALVARYADDAGQLAAAVIDAVRRHRGRDQSQDDVTVLILRRHP